MSKYEKSDALLALGEKVIAENPIFSHLADAECRIAYQVCENGKTSNGKTVYADTEKVKDKLKALLPYDFVITFYADAMILEDEILARLMYHELKHVGFDPDNLKYSIIPHDLEDFKEVVEKWGVDWIL